MTDEERTDDEREEGDDRPRRSRARGRRIGEVRETAPIGSGRSRSPANVRGRGEPSESAPDGGDPDGDDVDEHGSDGEPGVRVPGIVTAVTEHPRRKGRYVVVVDGRELATVGADVLAEAKVRAGQPVGAGQQAILREAGAETAVYDRALNLLGFRARSAKELRRRLREKEERPEVVDRVIERLQASGLLDDADYARQVARSKAIGQGHSRRRLQQELFKRGVARDIADEAIADVMADERVDESAMVEKAARKKAPSLAGFDPQTRRRRLYGFLARRGYGSEMIRRAIDQVLGGDPGGDATAEGPDEE